MLNLYGTENCHLCEDAQLVLREAGLSWRDVEISEDDALLARYGTKIPVLLRPDSGDELCWPFGVQEVQDFMQSP
ncbi:MAG TPA: glutaredoxin family protein [Methylophilaceae bacterium]|nr:glutaredoxin family protein [Methylophilaceae bacterium]HQR60676.1 glutaredoxin family protein [Methylophilaceae bacterium]